MQKSLMQGRRFGEAVTAQKSHNVNKSDVATKRGLIVEPLLGDRRRIHFCTIQETRWFCTNSQIPNEALSPFYAAVQRPQSKSITI